MFPLWATSSQVRYTLDPLSYTRLPSVRQGKDIILWWGTGLFVQGQTLFVCLCVSVCEDMHRGNWTSSSPPGFSKIRNKSYKKEPKTLNRNFPLKLYCSCSVTTTVRPSYMFYNFRFSFLFSFLSSFGHRQLLEYKQQAEKLYRQGKGVSIYDDGERHRSLRI